MEAGVVSPVGAQETENVPQGGHENVEILNPCFLPRRVEVLRKVLQE